MGFDLYQTITDRIIAEMEKGTVPWQRPWSCSSGAVSHVTGKPYSVLNQLMLPQSGEYVTFKQALAEGHPVRKGEKSHMVFFFKMVETQDRDSGEITAVPFLRYYPVFHISQCEGMKPRFAVSVQQENQLQPDAKADQIISDYIHRSGVKLVVTQSSQAYYKPSEDKIVVPELSQYACVSEYYSTTAHECVHSTGHPSRLNRITNMTSFGSETYSKEELVAELGAAYIVHAAGLETEWSFKNSAAYIQNWLDVLKYDKRFIVSAAGKAEKAVKMILGELEPEETG